MVNYFCDLLCISTNNCNIHVSVKNSSGEGTCSTLHTARDWCRPVAYRSVALLVITTASSSTKLKVNGVQLCSTVLSATTGCQTLGHHRGL